jgi:hypothetical protein
MCVKNNPSFYFSDLYKRGEWEVFLSYVRFYLLQWHDLVFTPIISTDDIENLIV